MVQDTGAQVCVAGPELLATLCIAAASLTRRRNLRDVANVNLKPMDAFTCRMQLGSSSTMQEVFIMKTATKCYISLQAFKDLGLVHVIFPY